MNVLLRELYASLRDGHTTVHWPRELWDEELHRPAFVEGQVIVRHLIDPDATRSRGARVLLEGRAG